MDETGTLLYATNEKQGFGDVNRHQRCVHFVTFERNHALKLVKINLIV